MRRALEPASAEEVTKVLTALAQVFRCELPEQIGMNLYVGSLQTVGTLALRRAAAVIVTQHHYPTLPLPADILRAAGGPQNTLQIHAARLGRALAMVQ